jgi:hypothetical protein
MMKGGKDGSMRGDPCGYKGPDKTRRNLIAEQQRHVAEIKRLLDSIT